jgi:hypothetical protein
MASNRSQAKLDQILVAAQKQFCRYGLSKTTMNDIAEEIGMSKASLYYYFVDKESLFTAVVLKNQESFINEIQLLIKNKSNATSLLKEFVLFRIALFEKLITPGKFSFESYMEIKPLVSTVFQNFRNKEIKLVSEILKMGVVNNEFKKDNLKGNVEFFLNTLHGIRQISFTGNTSNESSNLQEKTQKQLKDHSLKFTELFIKGLSN